MIVMEDYYVGDIKFNRIHSDKERFIGWRTQPSRQNCGLRW